MEDHTDSFHAVLSGIMVPLTSQTMPRILCWLLGALGFGGLLALLAYHSLTTFDSNVDLLAYHLPFAAFRAGISNPRYFLMSEPLVAAYDGFPLVMDYINGLIWKFTGNVNAANLVPVTSLGLFTVFLKTAFRVPASLGLTALLAIPTIQTMASISFPDVPANLALCAALISGASYIAVGNSDSRFKMFILCAACLSLSANLKPQFVVLAGITTPFFLGYATYCLYTKRYDFERTRPFLVYSILILSLLCVYWNPLRNFIDYGNPIFPVQISVLGHKFPGIYNSEMWAEPHYLRHTMQPLRWLASIVEYHAFDDRPLPYTVGQGNVPADDMSSRMGGYFFPFVAATVLTIAAN